MRNQKTRLVSGFLVDLVEVPGIEPGSEKEATLGTTCFSPCLFSFRRA